MPPNIINEIITSNDDFSTQRGVFKEDSSHFGNIKTHLMDVKDSHFSAVQTVHEWCGLAIQLLTTYKKLNNLENESRRRTVLVRALDDDKLSQAQNNVNKISSDLKEASEEMKILQDHHQNEPNSSVLSFAQTTGSKLNKAHTGSAEINEKLKTQIETIKSLKVQIQESESHSELSNVAIESAEKLIADCVEYRKIATHRLE